MGRPIRRGKRGTRKMGSAKIPLQTPPASSTRQQFLDVSKLEGGNVDIHAEATEINKLLTEAWTTIGWYARMNFITVGEQ